MNTKYLREFLVLAQTGNMTRAASRLFISEPALSKHIATLEEHYGCKLFDRQRRPMCLTPVGTALVPDIEAIVAAEDAAKMRARELRKMKPERIRVLTYHPNRLAEDLVQSTRYALAQSRPLLEIEEVQANGDTPPCELIEQRYADVYVGMTIPTRDGDFIFEKLFDDRETVVVRRSNPLATCQSVCFNDLDSVPVLMPSERASSEMEGCIARLFENHGVRPNFVHASLSSFESFLSKLDSRSCTFIPFNLWQCQVRPSVLAEYASLGIEEPEAFVTTYAVYRSADQSDALREFVAAMVGQSALYDSLEMGA